jgi:TATA-box binding protein (TBP) (component of TFIID and TFIIIB)
MGDNDISFDDMFDLLLSGGNEDNILSLNEPTITPASMPIAPTTGPITTLTAAAPTTKRAPKAKSSGPIKVDPNIFDTTCNILDNSIKMAFENDIGDIDNEIFTQPIPTTFTMEGFLSNVKFDEEQFIHLIEPNENVVVLNCNFGKKIHHSYTEPVVVKKNKRGRKKKEKVQGKRKIQGSGKCFNSQITFIVRADTDTSGKPIIRTEGMDPHDDLVYKFKVFRNGRLQLPGAKPILINDIIGKVTHVIDMLNKGLYPNEKDPSKLISIININPVMKNYKFAIKLGENHIIDLMLLKHKLMKHRVAEKPDAPKHPLIIDVNYTRESTKNAITFATPLNNKPKKVTKLNIFMSGKVNILGAYHSDTARELCDYIRYIFKLYPELIVNDTIAAIQPVEITLEDELKAAHEEIMNYMGMITEEQMRSVNNYLKNIFNTPAAKN